MTGATPAPSTTTNNGRVASRGAWQHVEPPEHAAALRDTVAFAWRAMDAFYEEDERILGHAADPYHRIDVRRTSRHLVVEHDDQVVADSRSPFGALRVRICAALVGRVTIDGEKLEPVPDQTVISHGPDRNLSVDEIGGIQLVEEAVTAEE